MKIGNDLCDRFSNQTNVKIMTPDVELLNEIVQCLKMFFDCDRISPKMLDANQKIYVYLNDIKRKDQP